MKRTILLAALFLMLTAEVVCVAGDEPLDGLLTQLVQDSEQVEQKSKALHARLQEARKAQQERDEAWRQQDEETWYSVFSKNFVVTAIGKSFAEDILAAAEAYRMELAPDLAPGNEEVLIHVGITDGPEDNFALVKGRPPFVRGAHRVWLETSRQRATGDGLKAELRKVFEGPQTLPEGQVI